MAWIYLAESADSLKPWLPGCGHSPTVKMTDTLRRAWFLGWQRAHFLLPQFGMMSERFTEEYLQGIQPDSTTTAKQSISSMAASRARTSVLQAMEQAWQESEAVFSGRSFGCVASFDPISFFWKTSQQSLIEAAAKWSGPLPRWGMTVDGALFLLSPLAKFRKGRGGLFWPRPRAQMSLSPCQTRLKTGNHRHNLEDYLAIKEGVKPGGPVMSLNLGWVEWLMGYPAGWTELSAWAMQWFRPKRGKRLKSCQGW